MTAHWGVADPAAFEGPVEEQCRVFLRAYMELHRRIELFTCLPIESLDRLALAPRLEDIGKTDDPTGEDE
jgi:arsenate reductase